MSSHASALQSSSAPAAGGQTGNHKRGTDWASSPMGPPSAWPPLLGAAVQVCLSSAAPALICWGPELILVCNDAAFDLFGDCQEALLGRPLTEVESRFGRMALGQIRKVQNSGGAAISTFEEKTLSIRNQAKRRLALTCTPLRNSDGSVAGYSLSCSSETPANGTNREMRESEQRLRLALQVGRLAIFDLDLRTDEFTWS